MQLSCFIALGQQAGIDLTSRKLKLSAEVVFGVSSQGCRGAGICKLATLSDTTKEKSFVSPCKRALAHLSKSENGTLCFRFEKASMCKKTIKRYFQNDCFSIDEDFELPTVLQERLAMPGKVIKHGVYPVLNTPDTFVVFF